ncbi:hypothetical protein RRF57_000115 [Xylaria bambusicola]|uniref:Uncharacterized protein n=1 Tax=Xylaria bambusicola TaxID=326684 RepID=A0AAN7U994_9PEZI
MPDRGAVTSSSQLWSFVSLEKPTETIPTRTYVAGFPSRAFKRRKNDVAVPLLLLPPISSTFKTETGAIIQPSG